MKTRTKLMIAFFAYLGMLGMAFVFYAVFLVAYSHPANKVILDINMFGEAFPELILFSTVMGLGLVGAWAFRSGIRKVV